MIIYSEIYRFCLGYHFGVLRIKTYHEKVSIELGFHHIFKTDAEEVEVWVCLKQGLY